MWPHWFAEKKKQKEGRKEGNSGQKRKKRKERELCLTQRLLELLLPGPQVEQPWGEDSPSCYPPPCPPGCRGSAEALAQARQ